MKNRFRVFRRGNGIYYSEDLETGKQESLRTKDRAEASRLVHASNEAHVQPYLNLRIARAYLTASDPAIRTRTWQHAMEELAKLKTGATLMRWKTAISHKGYDLIRDLPILETRAEHFIQVLASGGVSTNVYLRRVHNFALDMNWLPAPVIIRRQWPEVRFREKRAITLQEHLRVIVREKNPEWRAFYQLAWYLGASQSDLAHLRAEDIDWENKVISFERMKLRWRGVQPPQICFGREVEEVLLKLPTSEALFPRLSRMRHGDRATAFKERCRALGITGVTLHSYRYAWAERAKTCGYPERFAQQALGHNSKAVHRAYARKARVRVPALEEYERAASERKIIPIQLQKADAVESSQFQATATPR